ncbi:hypothetical protein [Metaclostridioides mangenotii]|uniref:hypothetical protein n=1 Tax=Metaclostridioides mangenotii TaxID=1540 RepID=UPI000480EA0C|nr:hypothetical protein [Clostridioides mangenotii]
MLGDSKELFDKYLIDCQYYDIKKATLLSAYKKMERWEFLKSKDLESMTRAEIVDLCQTGNDKIANRSYIGLQVMMDAVNEILVWANSKVKLSMKDFDIDEIFLKANDRYFTKEEIQDICNLFMNPQDKFIIYGLYSGIYGKAYSDLLELKIDDIDMKNRLINCPTGKIIEIDDFLYNILKDTIDHENGSTYRKYIDEQNEGSTTPYYKLNLNSPYIIKAKPYSVNNDGLDPMKINGIQRRLNKLGDISDTILSGKDLIKSGIMNKMYEEEKRTGKEWTCITLKDWFIENDFKGHVYETYKAYNTKYKTVYNIQ